MDHRNMGNKISKDFLREGISFCFIILLISQLSLKPEEFFRTTDKYMQSFIKDGKKLNPDFEILNELYVVTIGDNFNEKQE